MRACGASSTACLLICLYSSPPLAFWLETPAGRLACYLSRRACTAQMLDGPASLLVPNSYLLISVVFRLLTMLLIANFAVLFISVLV
jgi:hypothetical protein